MRKISKVFEPKWIIVSIFFLSGVFLGVIGFYVWLGVPSVSVYKIHPQKSEYKYINPLLGIEFYDRRSFSVDKTIELEMDGAVDQAKKDHDIDEASIYFRDIEPGYFAGVNENAVFSPGKLLQIPIMIAYFKLAETDPTILEIPIKNTYPKASRDTNGMSSLKGSLAAGETYTVNELIRRMITNSDDIAADLLFDHIDKDVLNEVFSDLGINFKEDKETLDYISLKMYSLFFRTLYNATYLSREFSEESLSLLSDADTTIGIGASLPKEIPIAHKFGSREFEKNGISGYETHDCGVVYYPQHPYLLCVSATGQSSKNIEKFLKDLSWQVYLEMEYRYKK